MIGYRFVHDHRAEHRVTDLCRVAGVNRSGYYAWLDRPMSDRDLDDAYLANEIHAIFTQSRGTYGSPRVAGQLRRAGCRHGTKRVASVKINMREDHPHPEFDGDIEGETTTTLRFAKKR